MFAPLARLLGLYSIKEELEALSFMYSDPEAYAAMQWRLDALAKLQGDVVLSVSLECFHLKEFRHCCLAYFLGHICDCKTRNVSQSAAAPLLLTEGWRP